MAKSSSGKCEQKVKVGCPCGSERSGGYQKPDGQICSTCLFNDIRDGISRIENGVNTIETALKDVGSVCDSKATRDTISDNIASTKKLVRSLNKTITTSKAKRTYKLNKMYRMQVRKFASKFEKAVEKYEAVMKEANDKMKSETLCQCGQNDVVCSLVIEQETRRLDQGADRARVHGQDIVTQHGMDIFHDSKETVTQIEEPSTADGIHSTQCQIHASNFESNLDFLREREEMILKLEADITDANQLFRDIANIVHAQNETIDDIESHFETVNTAVENGCKDLAKAAELKNPSASHDADLKTSLLGKGKRTWGTCRKTMYCLLVVLVLILGTFIITSALF